MKPFIILFALISLGCVACNNQDQSNGSNPGAITDTSKFTSILWLDSLVNFGNVNMGEKVQVAFKFRNIGTKPLYLTNVRAGCGCTVPDFTKGAIAPGKEGEVTGAFDTNKAHAGEVRKNIFVTTNTQNGINHTLTFTGIIKEAAPVK
jgi:hypothetical protein